MRYLLQIARVTPSATEPIPGHPADWDQVLDLAEPHGMEPLLFRHLSRTGHDHVPPDAWDRIVAAQEENAGRNLAATGELLALLRDFETAGVPALTYKGPVLAQQLYGDVSARRFGDLDIMVRPSHVRLAREVLLDRGYVTETELPGWRFDAFLRIQKEIAFIHRQTLQEVDLQWTVTEHTFGLRWDLAGMWRRAKMLDVAGASVRTFAGNELALILCVHGATHLWERLGWIADLGRFIGTAEVDWAEVLERARDLRAERMVVCSLDLAERVTGCGIPASARAVSTRRTRALTARLLDRVTIQVRDGLPDSERPFHFLLAHLRDRVWDQARYTAGVACTPTVGDWKALPLPRSMEMLHYVIRPFRLALRYGLGLVSPRRDL